MDVRNTYVCIKCKSDEGKIVLQLDSITDSMEMSLSKLQEKSEQEAWRAAVHGVAKNWT